MSRIGPRLDYRALPPSGRHETAWTLPADADRGLPLHVRTTVFTERWPRAITAELALPAREPAAVAATRGPVPRSPGTDVVAAQAWLARFVPTAAAGNAR